LRECVLVFGPPETAHVYAALLDQSDRQVILCSQRGELLAQLSAQRIEVILLAPGMGRVAVSDVFELLAAAQFLAEVPVVALLSPDEVRHEAEYLRFGADACLRHSVEPAVLDAWVYACAGRSRIRRRSDEELRSALAEARGWIQKLVGQVIPIGAAVSQAPDFIRLLERILLEGMGVASADGGTIYLYDAVADALEFKILHNRSLGISLGGADHEPAKFAPLPLHDTETGKPNHRSVATHVALTGRCVNVPDIYASEAHDFSAARAFDTRTGYRSVSLLTVPLKNESGGLIGVMQLINAQGADGRTCAFSLGSQQVVEGLAVLAAAVLGSYLREQELRSRVRELKIEVDEYNKSRQVAEITSTDYFRELQERASELRGRSTDATMH
jgi:CheY-like chemotaxis protein